MSDLYGNAIDFFDNTIPQGRLNKRRNSIQYRNHGNEKTKPDDLIVSKYGHVAIVTKVSSDYIEVIQQNVYNKPREKYKLKNINGKWIVGADNKIIGWLRLK